MRNHKLYWLITCFVVISLVGMRSFAAQQKPSQNQGGSRKQAAKGPQGGFRTNVPLHDFDIILGRVTQNSVTLSILAYRGGEGVIKYGVKPGEFSLQTATALLKKGEPKEISLKDLQPNTRYYYQFDYRQPDAKEFAKSPTYTFITQRAPGSSFVFNVQADPHLDQNTNTDLYQVTLANESAANPDFQIDLGDTFMTNKYRSNFKDALQQYLAQRYYFGLMCHSAPLYLTLGNHDGEGWVKKSSLDDMSVWATTMRKKYYPNPYPDGFYTGNSNEAALTGLPENYYAWEWGNALFVVLDPFRYTSADKGWDRTLGEQQYHWLQQTLEKSKAKFKFIFIHNLVGGADLNGKARGGAEVAKLYEWGGLNEDGTEGFKQHRPGWSKPIHQLLVDNHVSAVFHGHDHFFAKQELDGIIYQMAPQPGNSRATLGQVRDYGYEKGVFLPGAGYLRISVTATTVQVDYIRSDVEKGANEGDGEVAYSYSIGSVPIPGANFLELPVSGTDQNLPKPDRKPGQQPDRKSKKQKKQDENQGLRKPQKELAKLIPGNPDFVATEILGRPTDRSITVNVAPAKQMELYIEYGSKPGIYSETTPRILAAAAMPIETLIEKLQPNTRYYYRLRYRQPGENVFAEGQEHTFITRRAPGSAFTFCIQGDSHPERAHQFDPELYLRTMRNVQLDQPDFYLTSGDDFSVDTMKTITKEAVTQLYIDQRRFLGLVGSSAPLFLVNGNHEQAARYVLDGTPNNAAVWGQNTRNQYFSQPAPDHFYSGDAQTVEFIGKLRDYYAWTWGDALFVVIDPYWHSAVPVDNVLRGGAKRADIWGISLGEEQYRWLQQTLAESKAKYKFVFSHHVLGTGRGGADLADLYEWGGKNKNGVWEFDQKRPGWQLPIHRLLVKYKVTIFFQGHDHVFAKQERDGVIYQTLPEPADPNYALYNAEAYQSGVKYPNSGHVRVTVTGDQVKVDYIRALLPQNGSDGHHNGEVVYSYSAFPK